MAICEQCYHFDVCKNATIPNSEYKGEPEDKSKTCRAFVSRADVVEVKRGEWIYSKTYYTTYECNCSLCGQLMTTAYDVRMNYCPKCGAKMNGGNNV